MDDRPFAFILLGNLSIEGDIRPIRGDRGAVMSKALIVYGSTTGSTEMLASHIADTMKAEGIDVRIANVTDMDVEDLLNYETILLGSSTWGEGELQDDFISFYDDMEGLSLKGKRAAAFGCGDSAYGHFCEAVDLLEKKLRACGAQIIAPGLKIDGDVTEAESKAEEWAKQIAGLVRA